MTDLITAEVVKLREIAVSEKELSNAYLRIRAKLQAWDTKPGGVDRFEITEAALDRLTAELAAANAREAGLREALDKARDQGREPDYCYDNEWEYTLRWDEWQDLVDSHDTSEPVEVNTLFKGPTKWVAFVPNSRDEDGNPNDWDAVMVDSEAEARAALAQPSTGGGA